MRAICSKTPIRRLSELLRHAGVFPAIVFLVTLIAAATFPVKLFAQAPAISYSSPQFYNAGIPITPLAPTSSGVAPPGSTSLTTISGNNAYWVQGVTVDAAGNVFFTDFSASGVLKIPAGADTSIWLSIGVVYPINGIALDPAGNVYFTNLGYIYKLSAPGQPNVNLNLGLVDANGVAFDAAGNMYVADGYEPASVYGPALGTHSVYKYPAGGGSAITLSSAFTNPEALAVDAQGNVYVADNGSNSTVKIPAGGGTPVTIASGFNGTHGVAVDASGNVYMTDYGNNLVREIPAGGGAPFNIGSGFGNPYGVATDAAGNVYVADVVRGGIKEFKRFGGYSISPALPPGLSMDSATGIISGTPTAVSPATNYTITASNGWGSSTTTLNIQVKPLSISYASPQNYTVGTLISPLAPNSVGVAPVGHNSTPVTAGAGFNGPTGLAVDAAGNVYVSDANDHSVKKIPAGGGSIVTLDSEAPNYPQGIAVDAAGNVYVSWWGSNAVKEIRTIGGSPITLGSGFSSPTGVAVDPAGNVYVADYGNNAVKKIPAGGGAPQTIGSGFSSPAGVAVDVAGNVYVADYGNFAIKMIPAGGGGVVVTANDISSPYGIAIDASGNLFTSDQLYNTITEIPAGGGSPVVVASGFNVPSGVAIDGAGNLYVADQLNNVVKQFKPNGGYYVSPALPAGLSFNNATGVFSGTPTAVVPATTYTVTAYNSYGSNTAPVNITVGIPAPVINYNSPQTYTLGTPIATLAPVSSGGPVGAPAYSNTTLALGSGFNQPFGVAVDVSGNVYVADFNHSLVKKIPAGGGAPVTLGSGFLYPTGVAVDAAGTVYVADYNGVKKIVGGGTVTITMGSGFSSPEGVAVDVAGNVYVADTNNNAIKEIPVGGGAPITIGNGFSVPAGIATDAAGNIYVADYGNNAVKKIPAGGGNPIALGSGFNAPSGVAIDAAGDVFVADNGNNSVKEIPAGTGTPVALSPGFITPNGVAVDGAGNVYVGDTGNSIVKEIHPTGGYFINTSLPSGLSFNDVTGAITGTPASVSLATVYSVTAYNGSSGCSATLSIAVNGPFPAVSYSSPKTYTLNKAIPALTPTSSKIAAPGYSNTKLALGAGFGVPQSVAIDASGNIYVADYAHSAIKEIPAGGGIPVVLGSGFSFPFGVAVDAAGNIYVADSGNNAIKKMPAGGGTPVTIGSGFIYPEGVAVDAAGNVYVADNGDSSVKEILAANGNVIILGYGFLSPQGIAVDAAGNVYVADNSSSTLKMLPAGNGTMVNVGSGLAQPMGLAVDASGDIYVADHGTNTIKEISAGGGTTVVIASGFNAPGGVALDTKGNVYVADSNNNAVEQISPVGGYYLSSPLPTGLIFSGTTGVISGTPTTLSLAKTYIVTAYNASGNAAASVSIAVTPSAALSALKLSNGVLSPAFSSTTTGYTASVSNGIASLILTPTTVDPDATVKINGTSVTSGTASGAIPLAEGAQTTIKAIVTAQDGKTTKTYSLVVTRAPSTNANLATLGQSVGGLAPAFSAGTTGYTMNVNNPTGSITLKPSSSDANATIKVNGVAVQSGTVSAPIVLAEGGQTVITAVVTAQDGVTTKTYTLTVTRGPSANASLAALIASKGTLSPTFSSTTTGYTTSVANTVASITVVPLTTDANATIKVNGTTVASGTASGPIALAEGANTTISVVITAQNGTTKEIYVVTVSRAPSVNANLSTLGQSIGGLTPAFTSTTTSYTEMVSNATTSMTIKPVSSDANAIIKVNGTAITSGTMTAPIALSVGANTITTIVTAQNGTTTKTYTLTVTRASGSADNYDPGISVTKPTETVLLAGDGIVVHQGVSPNGDGINDFLQIDNISQYADNKLMIMNRNGEVIYEAKGYDNSSKVFDGHSNKNGQMQLPGTYFYQLDYTVNGITKHKTGFIVLKY